MKRKLSLIFCTVLIISAFAPIIATAVAKKPGKEPRSKEKMVIVHYKKGHAKPPGVGGGKPPKESDLYKLLGKGVEWKTLSVDYVINPINPDGLPQSFLESAFKSSAGEWDDHMSLELIGSNFTDSGADWDDDVPDGRNEFVFGNYTEKNVIAVTIIWGYFSGPPKSREITEFDILFDTDFTWGDATVNQSVMDLQNIATHEIGHGLGLADLYDSSASEQTMYGYSTEGEIKKRDLNSGDIAGIQDLYGE
ncbi:MAG: matrixin family metalloprotease [Candidatus Bathyarchaeota archaeon]|nr:matrixin family metalloprotease [Candidatus Bathyarchaeota archaeon]